MRGYTKHIVGKIIIKDKHFGVSVSGFQIGRKCMKTNEERYLSWRIFFAQKGICKTTQIQSVNSLMRTYKTRGAFRSWPGHSQPSSPRMAASHSCHVGRRPPERKARVQWYTRELLFITFVITIIMYHLSLLWYWNQFAYFRRIFIIIILQPKCLFAASDKLSILERFHGNLSIILIAATVQRQGGWVHTHRLAEPFGLEEGKLQDRVIRILGGIFGGRHAQSKNK